MNNFFWRQGACESATASDPVKGMSTEAKRVQNDNCKVNNMGMTQPIQMI